MEELYDVVAVNHKTRSIRMFGERKTLPNAEAIASRQLSSIHSRFLPFRVFFDHTR